jgi:hypothetical protein
MRRWTRRAISLPSLLIAAGIGGLAFELVHPTDPAHATAAFGIIGTALTLGGTLALEQSRTADEDQRRREEHAWRKERLEKLDSLRRRASPEEAALLEEMAADDDS